MDLGLIERLLDLGVDLHARTGNGEDAFMLACINGFKEIASLLLEHGTDRFTRDDKGCTALIHASDWGHSDIVELLVDQPELADDDLRSEWEEWLHAVDDFGGTALHVAVADDQVDCIKALIGAGFDVNFVDDDGITALHHAKNVETARILLDAGAEDTGDVSAIMAALKEPERAKVLRLLLQRLPDAESDRRPYLIAAVEADNLEAVRILLDVRPAEYVNKRDPHGRTGLICSKNAEITQLLLERGADPRIVDAKGQSALMVNGGVPCVPIRPLLEAAPDLVGVEDRYGRRPVAFLSNLDALEELFRFCEDHGVDVGKYSKDEMGDTAVHRAMSKRDLPIVKLLLEKGIDAMIRNNQGTTALMQPFLNRMRLTEVSAAQDDPVVEECLRAVLDAVILHGGGGAADVE